MIYGNYGTYRQSFYKINPSSEDLKWIKNGYKPDRLWEIQGGLLAFPGPLTNLTLFDRIKPFLATGLIPHNKKKKIKIHFLQSPVIRAPTLLDRLYRHWQKFHELLRDYHTH